MYKLLTRRVTNHAQDERFCWLVGFLFLVVCTTLMLKMLPTLGLLASAALVLCVSAGRLVTGWQAPSLWRLHKREIGDSRGAQRGSRATPDHVNAPSCTRLATCATNPARK